ncbi:MAG: ABC transporter ATP-binding protein [Desulfobulbaceae bacterium]|nr:ABC transporter ATP-binding protein [Desulfobulbaceae bacterium]
MGQTVIDFQQVTKTYRLYSSPVDRVKEAFHPLKRVYHHDFDALKNISFTISKGETVGIAGRNGSGKSTLLQLACSILQPTSGRVVVDGRISALLELGAGFNPEFTGRQNVYLNGAILGLRREEIDNCFADIAEFAGIGDFIDQPVKMYSSGMYVRLAFAVAINVNPDILMVDEALAVGDAAFQAKCFAKFREFQERGVTIIFVTHAIDLITKYCSRALLLDQGSLLESGGPKEVVDAYNRLLVGSSTRREKAPAGPVPPAVSGGASPREKWQGLFTLNPHENRYGDGRAEIIEGGFFDRDGQAVQTLFKGETCEIRMRILFRDTVEEPILAYTIKDIKGFDITGTNTWFQNIATGTFRRGDLVEIVFSQVLLLNAGSYLISFGCAGHEKGNYVVYDRRYDYLGFDVVSETRSVGFFDLESEITVRRITNGQQE